MVTREEELRAALVEQARLDGFGMAYIETLENQHENVDALREAWREEQDARAGEILSALNRERLDNPTPSGDPGVLVGQAIYHLHGASARWPLVRAFLVALWGLSEEDAERAMFAAVGIWGLGRPEAYRLTARQRPIGLRGAAESSWPELDWVLTLKPNRLTAEEVRLELR